MVITSHAKKIKQNEVERLVGLLCFDEEVKGNRYTLVAGVDEAGRGPLAGPVMAAAVVLPPQQLVKCFEFKKEYLTLGCRKEMSFTSFINENSFLLDELSLVGLNDSKKLAPAKRKSLAGQIKEIALAWAIGVSSVEEILRENIYKASFLAMKRAIEKLRQYPVVQASCLWLVDGFKIPGLEIPQMAITGGDRLSAHIAASSILAKVTRDKWMEHYHEKYPQYGFDRHKGYGTKQHLNMLRQYGPSPIHRLGFQPVKEVIARGKFASMATNSE